MWLAKRLVEVALEKVNTDMGARVTARWRGFFSLRRTAERLTAEGAEVKKEVEEMLTVLPCLIVGL